MVRALADFNGTNRRRWVSFASRLCDDSCGLRIHSSGEAGTSEGSPLKVRAMFPGKPRTFAL